MKALLNPIISILDDTSGVLTSDEFSASASMNIALSRLRDSLIEAIEEERIKIANLEKMSEEERSKSKVIHYDIRFMKELKNLCETIIRSNNYYITKTREFNTKKVRRFFDLPDDEKIKSKREKVKMQIVPPHEIYPFTSRRSSSEIKRKIKEANHYFKNEGIYTKLLDIEENFSRNILILMAVLERNSV